MYKLISLFNHVVLCLFEFLYKYCKFESLEDKFHEHKKNTKSMNKVKLEFVNKNEFDIVKTNILYIINNKDFLKKYDITTNSILTNSNNKLVISFKPNCIYVHFNHYFISGPNMFILLNKMVNSSSPKFLATNPFLGIIYLPFYIYNLLLLQKREYIKTEKQIEHVIIEKNIIAIKNKKYYSYFTILNKIYKSLQLNRPMTVALSIAFEELQHITNNVGLIIINYEIKDTIETLEQKIENAYYQAYCSNFIINCPLPSI